MVTDQLKRDFNCHTGSTPGTMANLVIDEDNRRYLNKLVSSSCVMISCTATLYTFYPLKRVLSFSLKDHHRLIYPKVQMTPNL